MTDLKFSCSQCGQHLECTEEWTGASLACPTCGTLLEVPGVAVAFDAGSLPQSGQSTRQGFILSQKWVSGACLVLLGALTPFAMLLGVAVTLLLGPLVIVAAPVAGILLSRCMAAYCLQRVGLKAFWPYPLAVALSFAVLIVPELLHPHRGGTTLDGALAGMYSGMGILLTGGCALLWAIGLLAALVGGD